MTILQTILIAIMGLIGLWSLALLVSTIKMMKQVKVMRGLNRKNDLWQLVSLILVFGMSTGLLVLDPQFIADHPATISGVSIGVLFALFYINQKHSWHCNRIKALFTKKQP